MRKFCGYAVLATTLTLAAPMLSLQHSMVSAQETTTVSEEAQLLYEQAVEFKKSGKLADAVESYIKALRKDRTVLAFDDNGLIDASYEASIKKLSDSPEDVKLLETCGFLASVGYSDNKTAITYYEKILGLVEDEAVKERTQNLIERLKIAAEAQQNYNDSVISQKRDERLAAWTEAEKLDKFAQERAEANERSSKLSDAYSDKESLENTVPQLEEELKELQEAYDKADRLWYTLNDELYERRRRRLKHEIASKTAELEEAKAELSSAERRVSKLEKEDEEFKKQEREQPFVSADEYEANKEANENSAFNDLSSGNPSNDSSMADREPDNDGDENESNNDYGNMPSDEYSEEALARDADEMSDEERSEKIDELIDGL